MRALSALGAVACVVTWLILTHVMPLAAQPPASTAATTAPPAQTVAELRGHLTRMVTGGREPVPDRYVVLHRSGPDSIFAVDSVVTARDGAFTISVRTRDEPRDLYFLSASNHGVAYFSDAWTNAELDSAVADMVVFDTTTAEVRTVTLGRLLIVSAPDPEGRRRIGEVHEIANDSTVTRISPGADMPVWRTPVPAGAIDFNFGQEGTNPASLTASNAEVMSFAPFAPGLKSIFFSYTLGPDDFPLEIQLETGMEMLRVLLEEPDAAAMAPGLNEETPEQVQGRLYRQFVAVAPGAGALSITVPDTGLAGFRLNILIVVGIVGVGMLIAILQILRKRAVTQPARNLPSASAQSQSQAHAVRHESDALAHRIAALDASFKMQRSPTEGETLAYEQERARLRAELAALLARQNVRT